MRGIRAKNKRPGRGRGGVEWSYRDLNPEYHHAMVA